MKKMKRSIIAIVTATIMMLSFLTSTFYLGNTNAVADSITDDYALVHGVLDTDKYSLYPFSTSKSLTIGFSKYGEMIDDRNNVGLEYGAVDPFAAPAGGSVGSIPKVLWIQGWLLNITYFNIPQGKNRNVWACAMFSDSFAYGGTWIRVDFTNDYSTTYGWEDPRDPGYIIGNYAAGSANFGGRKTNGTAVTMPITVLYNGPRMFAALLNTTIYDHPIFGSDSTANDIPLARVFITIIFNKVKKEVILLKDVKSLLTEKTGVSMEVQFSNRGEVDLGTEVSGYHSYFHFYTEGTGTNDTLSEGQDTVYDRDWTANPTVDLGTQSATGGFPQTSNATYDVAQAIKTTTVGNYTWWAAFWPSLSDWTIDGWGIHYRSMTAADAHWIDGDPARGGEPRIPFYIGEWDFKLWAREYAATNPVEFRGVTVYGLSDLNDGSDTPKLIDREALYQLNEVFNPWDLQQAVEKKTTRWVDFYTVPSGTGALTIYLDHSPVKYVAEWEDYCTFSERVEWGGALRIPQRAIRTAYDYELYVEADGDGYIYIPSAKRPAAGTVIKILYSTDTRYTNFNHVVFTYDRLNVTYSASINFAPIGNKTFTDYLGATHTFTDSALITISNSTNLANGANYTLTGTMDWYAQDIKVFKENPTTIKVYWQTSWEDTGSGSGINILFDSFELNWTITPPHLTDLHIDWAHIDMDYRISAQYNAALKMYNVSIIFDVNGIGLRGNELYDEHIPGRYEWVTVGRDAHTVDSLGAALVSAAFKNKQVEIGVGGMDMMGKTYAYEIPYVLHKFGTANALQDYFITPDTTTPGQRLTLNDDWCHTWPVSSSNIIAVGGPLANFVTLYFNDFTDAFYGAPWFTPYADWSGKIAGLTCWNRNAYANTGGEDGIGYASISTYKDINGTVGFLIWGLDARDTYYATQFFDKEIIFELQEFPSGATSIIIKIDYEDPLHPTWTIPEVLGTISETLVESVKGGIHPDP
jgi:hypothetical protein